MNCFKEATKPTEDSVQPQSSSFRGSTSGTLLQMDFAQPENHVFVTECELILHFSGCEPVKAQLLEQEVLHDTAGSVAMTAFDFGLAMGGPEAISESFYRVMDTQRQYGGQDHGTREERTLLDWSTSNVIQTEEVIRRAALLYLDGNKEERLARHRVGSLRKTSKGSYKASKVLTRFSNEQGRYPFLNLDTKK